MKLCSAREMATRWGISIQLVRRYCKDGKIAEAVLTEQGWMIPEGALKPGVLAAREPVITPLVKRILYERERNNHYGIYEYIQVNLAYSSRYCQELCAKLILESGRNLLQGAA